MAQVELALAVALLLGPLAHVFCQVVDCPPTEKRHRDGAHILGRLADALHGRLAQVNARWHLGGEVHTSVGVGHALGKSGAHQGIGRNDGRFLHHRVAHQIVVALLAIDYNIVCIEMEAERLRQIGQIEHAGEHPNGQAALQGLVQFTHGTLGATIAVALEADACALAEFLEDVAWHVAIAGYRNAIDLDEREEAEEQPRPYAEGHRLAHLQPMETHQVGYDTRFTVGRLMMFERDADVRHSVLCQRSSIHPR